MIIKSALWADAHTNTPGRVEEAHRVHEAMLEDWQQRGVDFIGFAGDWNEVPPNEQDQAWSRDFLGRCAQVAPVVMIYGNHCPAGSLDEFHAHSEHRYPITVVSRPDVIRVETAAGSLAVACVPFVWKAHLLAQLGPLSIEESDRAAQEQLAIIFRGLGVNVRDLGLPTIALVHGVIRGSRINEEQPARPLGMELPLEDLAQIGAGIAVAGHVHLQQSFSFNGRDFVVPGSPFFVDWGEAKYQKGYVWANISEMGVEWERVATPAVPMLLTEYRYQDGMFVRDGAQAHESDLDPSGSDIRLRFHYAKENEKTAKATAKELADGFYSQGAINVKLDPIPILAESARSLEIVKAKTLTEQAQLLWKKWDLKLSDQEERTLTGRIEEIQTECGFGQRLTLDASIHIKSVRLKGWRCFPDEINLDFDAMPGEVVAVLGPNGAGKSLLFEIALLGAVFREVPTHGKIGDHAIARDTFVETNFEYAGKNYTVSQIIDGQSGAGSTSLKIGKTPVFGTETALRTQYDKWADENLPPLSLVTSTTFMPQESKGILGMGATARKSLILKAKGVERYEVLAEAARKRSTAVSKELDKTSARIEELGRGQSVAFCEQALAKAVDEKRLADETLRLGELTLEDLRGKNAVIEKQRMEHDVLVRRRQELESKEENLKARIAELDQLIINCQAVLADKATIESAVEDIKHMISGLADLKANESELRIQQSEAQGRAREKRQELQRLNEKLAGLNQNIANANKVLASKDGIASAVASVAEFQESLKETHAERDQAFQEYERLQGAATAIGDTSRTFLRGELRYIADGNADNPVAYADSALSADDLAAKEIAERPRQILAVKAAWQQAGQRAQEISGQLASLTRLADRAPELKDAERIIEEAEHEIRELRSLSEELPMAIRTAEVALADIETALTSKVVTSATTQKEIEQLSPIAAKASRITEAALKIGLRREEREKVFSEREAVLESLSKVITETDAPPPLIPLSEHEIAISQARSTASGCQSTLALAEKALETAKAQETRHQELTASIRDLRKDVDWWDLVERTCGRDGLIAESVAAAGDEINETANKLLRASGNTKYTVDLKTTKMTKDGREIEGCPIFIHNAETGEWQEGSTLSPGQRAFINLPLSLTLAMIGCKDSTVRPTLFMDEPTAGLDPIMRGQFVEMVRYAVRETNASKALYVTHNEELAALSDARINIADGQITVT